MMYHEDLILMINELLRTVSYQKSRYFTYSLRVICRNVAKQYKKRISSTSRNVLVLLLKSKNIRVVKKLRSYVHYTYKIIIDKERDVEVLKQLLKELNESLNYLNESNFSSENKGVYIYE